MKSIKSAIAALLIAPTLGSTGLASGAELYPEAPPPDASFIRFFGATGVKITFAGKSFDLTEVDAGNYIPVSAALLSDVSAGSFVSVFVAADGTLHPVIEGPRDTRLKVHLFLVNGSGEAVDLRVIDGNLPVLQEVGPNSSGQRAVNPVAVTLGVFETGQDTPREVFEVSLQRGQNVSFVVTASGSQMIQNAYSDVQH